MTSSPTRRSAPADLFGQAVDNLRLCTAHGVVHGDLSPYNLLVWGGRSYFIDFPQAVDPVAHPDGLQLLECDVFTCASGRGATVYMRPGRALRRADGGRV